MALERSVSVGKLQPACAPSDSLLSLDFKREALTEPRARFQVGPRQPQPSPRHPPKCRKHQADPLWRRGGPHLTGSCSRN